MNRTPWLPMVRRLVAVASGKGGVGKTTVTVNLALALQRAGWRVGIFDADIYGPNIPLLLGIHQRRPSEAFVPVVRRKGAPAYIRPLERHGLKLMSVGLLLSEEQVINPPASTVGQLVIQTMRDVVWGELDAPLDVLLIDLPPSAGQPQEDLLSVARLDGVVIVTTPQDMSLLDAGRSLQMFKKAGVLILGVVENMSYFICPSCGERHEIFRGSGRWRPPTLDGVPVIGRVPLAAENARLETRDWRLETGRLEGEEEPQSVNGYSEAAEETSADQGAGRVFDEIAAVLREQLP